MSALSSGTRLGAYEILGHVGAGGMGDVYRARDGKRFLINSEVESTDTSSAPITVVLNWSELLNR